MQDFDYIFLLILPSFRLYIILIIYHFDRENLKFRFSLSKTHTVYYETGVRATETGQLIHTINPGDYVKIDEHLHGIVRDERQEQIRLDLGSLEEPVSHQESVAVKDRAEDPVVHEDYVQRDRDHLEEDAVDDDVFLVCLYSGSNLAERFRTADTSHILQADFVCAGIDECLSQINVVFYGVDRRVGDAERCLGNHSAFLCIFN